MKTTKPVKTKKKTKKSVRPLKVQQNIPIAYGRAEHYMAPQYERGSRRSSIKVSHREYFDIVRGGNATPIVATFPINPGMGSTFPWLAHLALCYEHYRFTKISVSYNTSVATSTPGRVMLMIDTDVNDTAPGTTAQYLNHADSVRTPTYRNVVLNYKTFDTKWRTCRAYAPSGNFDLLNYDLANLYVRAEGQGSTDEIGDLMIDYTVEFTKEQIEPDAPAAFALNDAPSKTDLMTNTTLDATLGVVKQSLMKLKFKEAGEYLINVNAFGTDLGNILPITLTPVPGSGALAEQRASPGLVNAAATNAERHWTIRVPTDCELTFGTIAATLFTLWSCRITKFPYRWDDV